MRVVVVGGGLAGLSVAWHLRDHARVVLIERDPAPGSGATAENAGMIRRLGEDPAERALALRTWERLAEPPDGFDGASRVTGAVLALASERHHLHDAAAHLRRRGVRIEPHDRPAELAPALVGSPLPFAWWLPDERVADAHRLVEGFRRGVLASGGEVRLGERVLEVRARGGRATGVATERGDVDGDAVVVAAGAWAGPLAGVPLAPIRRTLVTTAPHPRSSPHHPWVWVDDEGVYARPEAGGWLVSACDEAIDPPGALDASRGPPDPVARAVAFARLARWLPALGDAIPTGGWSGLRTFAADRRPVLGAHPALDGLWVAAGLGGFGVTGSFGVGEALATWITGGTVAWLARDDVAPGRRYPSRLLLRPDGALSRVRLVPAPATAGDPAGIGSSPRPSVR